MANVRIEVLDEDKFDIWYLKPIELLENGFKPGHGAICALMVVLPLYERVYRYAVLNGTPDNRPRWVKDDLHLNSDEEAKLFWIVFRDGLCHTGSFFEESDHIKRGNLPLVGLDGKYPAFPQFVTVNNQRIIQMNPWGFCKHVLDKYKNDPGLLNYSKAPLVPLYLEVSDGG